VSRKSIVFTVIGLTAIVVIICLAGHRNVTAWVEQVVHTCGDAGPWVYFGAMAILPIFGFSLFAFVASAGPVFVPTLGLGPVIAFGLGALAVNVSLSYLLARYALRPWAVRVIRHFGCTLPDICRYGPWEVSVLVRLLPGPPFGLQSCLLGVAGIPFGIYLATSLAIPALYFTGMVCLSTGATTHSPWMAAGAGLTLIAVCWAVYRLRLRLTRPWNGSGAALTEAG
jgi:uncharacterized membrane protein YdjX (TVP38/TMEM64 family)